MKRILLVIFFIPLFVFAGSFEADKFNSELKDISLNSDLNDFQKIKSYSDSRYNQQNIALAKIKLNEYQPDMDNSVILKLNGENIDFILKDLKKDGFKAEAYSDGAGYYFIMVDLTGKDVADNAIGLAKYYYVREVLVSKKVYYEIFGTKKALRIPVRVGTIIGGMNHSPVDVTINKIEWTIKGGMNLSPVDIKIDHNNKTITGGANHNPVELKFEWSTKQWSVEGRANLSPVKYTINWEKGILEGYSNNSQIRLEFDMKEGQAGENIVEINGYAKNAPVALKFDKITGKLTGAMNSSPVDITLTNCDLYDFLQYFFLFLN